MIRWRNLTIQSLDFQSKHNGCLSVIFTWLPRLPERSSDTPGSNDLCECNYQCKHCGLTAMGLVDTLIVGPGSYKKLRPRIASCSPQTLFKSVHWVAEESPVPGALFYAPQFGAHKSWTLPHAHTTWSTSTQRTAPCFWVDYLRLCMIYLVCYIIYLSIL